MSGGFRIGRGSSIDDMVNGAVGTSKANRYFSLIANGTNDTTTKQTSLYARGSNATTTKKVAVRFDMSTMKIEGFTPDRAPGPNHSAWYYLDSYIIRDYTMKLIINNASGTVSLLEMYNGKLTDAEITAFLT